LSAIGLDEAVDRKLAEKPRATRKSFRPTSVFVSLRPNAYSDRFALKTENVELVDGYRLVFNSFKSDHKQATYLIIKMASAAIWSVKFYDSRSL
jgi:hypothetical protein